MVISDLLAICICIIHPTEEILSNDLSNNDETVATNEAFLTFRLPRWYSSSNGCTRTFECLNGKFNLVGLTVDWNQRENVTLFPAQDIEVTCDPSTNMIGLDLPDGHIKLRNVYMGGVDFHRRGPAPQTRSTSRPPLNDGFSLHNLKSWFGF
eukprot:NP_001252256.1 Uncharacterized protein CELE_Y71A12B.25 [Caenorhabditis elegans]